MIRAGLIHNPTSRHNQRAGAKPAPEGVAVAAPRTREALDAVLAGFAASGIELLVVDGGDGTLREVLTRAPNHFPTGLPPVAVLPSGKTNALAIDIGAPKDWPLEAALASARQGRLVRRAPLEVTRQGASVPVARGFIFGAGVFVLATDLAQRTHRLGAFDSLAIGLTLGAAAISTLAGGPRSRWRSGVPMSLAFDGAEMTRQPMFLVLASTLERLPLGLKPFGPPAPGLQLLCVDAPPKGLPRALPPLLTGVEASWLDAAGYRRRQPSNFFLELDTRFVLDGEAFPGGALQVSEGAPVDFVAP